MNTERVRGLTVRFSAIALMFGGSVRIVASRRLFSLFGIGDLWPESSYSLYIYKVLGAFVVLVGVVLWMLSRNLIHYRRVFKGLAVGFLLVASVMILTGFFLGLSAGHFIVDPIFCLLLASLFWWVGRRE